MKIVIALDSFKGSLSAKEACRTVAEALASERPDLETIEVPMADGGEGTVDALVAACGGDYVHVNDVTGPLPEMRLTGRYGWLPEQQTAVIEMSNASGLPLLRAADRNPLRTTTYGTGQLIQHAAAGKGARRILLALGGSATVDGGTGAACACNWRFLDTAGNNLAPCGGNLYRVAKICPPDNDLLTDVDFEALCDVRNPLCGPNGAAAVYGPQKGATPEMVKALEAGLVHLGACIREELALDVADVPGAGAAGGFGAGALAFFGGRLVPGIEAVADTCGINHALEGANWVVTGEGKLDNQSLQGKVVDGVTNRARRQNVKVAAIAGRVLLSDAEGREAGIDCVVQTAPDRMSDEECLAHSREHLAQAARRLARLM